MKKDNNIVEDRASDIIDKYVSTAIEVIRFIINLPSPLSQFVFRQIVQNGYAVASVLPRQEQKEQLLRAVCDGLELSKQTAPVYCYLGVERNYRQLDDTVQRMDDTCSTDDLFEKLKELCAWETLPPSVDLIQAYDCFSFSDNGNAESLREIVRVRLTEVMKSGIAVSQLRYSCFRLLGFQTLFEKWIASMLDSNYDELFVNWYCKGEVIDVIIDTIAKSGVYSVSYALFERLKAQCEENYYLSIVVQQRYDFYRQFTASLPPYQFVYKGDKQYVQIMKCMALPKIAKSGTDITPVDNNCLYKLWGLLRKRGDIECEFLRFQSVFSGTYQETHPIKWLSDQNSLAVFLFILRGKNKADKEYAKKAASVFLQKNGKQCSENTLNQANTQAPCYREYIELFKIANISR